jgi:anti-sigma regulatory factor (Ser/Thr protein kinase)
MHLPGPPGGARWLSGAGGREGGELMTEAAGRESITLAGRAERARVVRTFTGEVLGPAHPCRESAILLVSELFSNSLRHSRSGGPEGTVTVAVTASGGIVRVEVADRSGPGVPQLRLDDGDVEDGRGLRLVEGLAARWGWRRSGGRTVTWFELRHG